MKNQLIPTESEEQQALFEWAATMGYKYPELHWMYAIPNGGLRNKATAARLKLEGVKKGVPDICIPLARKGFYGLYIELKRRDGGKTSPEQKEWIWALTKHGYLAVVCKGWDEAKNTIEGYLEV